MNWKQTIGLLLALGLMVALCFAVIFPELYKSQRQAGPETGKDMEATQEGEGKAVLPKLKGVRWKSPEEGEKPKKKPAARKAVATKEARPEKGSPAGEEAVTAEAPGPEPLLELLDMVWYEQEGYVIVEGTVRNVSKESLPSVQVHALFEGEGKRYIISGYSMIELNPIFPEQVSTFNVTERYYPEMKEVVLDFKRFAGESIPWRKAKVEEPEAAEVIEESPAHE
jgi:hypothetical protein